MTRSQAQRRAYDLFWRPHRMVVATLRRKDKPNRFEISILEDGLITVIGSGDSWEVAFAQAERRCPQPPTIESKILNELAKAGTK